jgi:hypothetical protein
MFSSRIKFVVVVLIVVALAALPYLVAFAGFAPGGSD